MNASISLLLIIVAIVCFLLVAFGVEGVLGIALLPFGLAVFAAAFIAGDRRL